ncbi:MAG: hypothetical protein HOP35_18330, partial [Nitrospira sp.]|nr:hypothetical protein [Nitrospira sp.]
SAMPGIVITTLERDGNRINLAGLRDPLAEDPEQILVEEGIPSNQITAHWSPYYSLDLPFIRQRATAMLNPPPTATLHFQEEHLAVTGTASHAWAIEAKKTARLIPGIQDYRDDDLRTVSIEQLIEQINLVSFLFDSGSSTLSEQAQGKLGPLRTLLEDLQILAQSSRQHIVVEAIGGADETGPETMNLLLATARAHTVIAALGGPSFGSHLTFTTGIETMSTVSRGRAQTPDKRKLLRRTSFFTSIKDKMPQVVPTP